MSIRNNKNKSKRQYLFLGVVVFVTFVVTRWAWGNYLSHKQAQAMLHELELRKANIETRLEKVQARNELLETDTGVQDFLIEKYAIKREGERVLVLVRDEDEEIVINEEEKTFWQKMKTTFFE